jgi:hypothetical protein
MIVEDPAKREARQARDILDIPAWTYEAAVGTAYAHRNRVAVQ